MPAAISIVALALLAQTGTSTSMGSVQARFTSGAEWDTNAERAVRAGEMPLAAFGDLEEVGDGLARVTADVSGRVMPTRSLVAWLGYQLGAKRFAREQSQDFFTHQFFGQGAWFAADAWTLGVSGSFRLSRIRSALRDYNIGSGSAYVRWSPRRDLSIAATGTFTGYRYLLDDHFDYRGPSAGLEATFAPISRLTISGGATHHWRNYSRNGLTLTNDSGRTFASFCDELFAPDDDTFCAGAIRRDTEIDLSIGARYVGTIQFGGQYRLRAQRSTSDYENTDRHRLTADVTFGILDDLQATVLAVLQFNNQTSVTDTLQQAEDDENRNNLSLGLRYALSDHLALDLRYALYVEQFSTNDASYLRQLFYLGLGYRTGTFDL